MIGRLRTAIPLGVNRMKSVTAWLLVIIAAALGAGGIRLISLGGSPAYLVMGLFMLVSGVLLMKRRPAALWTYALFLILTLAWSVWEVGLDWWALVPRGVLFSLIGIWLLFPFASGPRDHRTHDARANLLPPEAGDWRGARRALAAAVIIVGVTAVLSALSDSYPIKGTLPTTAQAVPSAEPYAGVDWPFYGGDRYGRRYSSLTDISSANVDKLKVAWTYHTGDGKRSTDPEETTFEVTPLKIGSSLYLCTAHNVVIALDATTGAEKWKFDPKISIANTSEHATCRGISYHTDASPSATTTAGATCTERLIATTGDARMFALDAVTGKPCADFGENGMISLLDHMPNPKPGFYMVTSPPVITGDIAILSAGINDNASANSPSGVVRAFDVHSGKLIWNWDPGAAQPNAVLQAGQVYSAGAPNMWSVGSVDPALGLVYVPLGNKSPDQYGGNRSPEVERFSAAVVALDTKTGVMRWVFQTVHHDLWDRDVPSQPTLIDLKTASGVVPALIQPTKQGQLYVLDRRDGKPVFPVTEVSFAGKALPGDTTSPTQPISALDYTPPPLKETEMWGATPFDQLYCRILYRSLTYVGPYTPPSLEGSLIYPGNTGIFNWGGIAVDPVRQVLIGSPLMLAFQAKMIKRENDTTRYVTKPGKGAFGEDFGGPYAVQQGPLTSPIGVPCQAPPWGALIGTDLATGKTVWRHRSGTTRDLFPVVALPLPIGVPGLGGPLVTAGGVFFYSGAMDNYLRAFDVTTGAKLWEGRLPAGGQATPMTYKTAAGKQMVVVAAGGHGSLGTTLGDSLVAFALD